MSREGEDIVFVESVDPLEFSFSKESSKKKVFSTTQPIRLSNRSKLLDDREMERLAEPLFSDYKSIQKRQSRRIYTQF